MTARTTTDAINDHRFTLGNLRRSPNELASLYSHFRVTERILLTGHSHQAWPDCGFDGQKAAWLDAAECVDEKWERAMAKAEAVKAGYRRLLNDPEGCLTLASNTHDLLIRFLSGLDLARRPRIVTTDGEFHSLRRQMDRLAEEPWIEIVRVPTDRADQISTRLIEQVNDRTAAVLVSSVLFQNANIVPHLDEVARACAKHGCELLVDTYHHLNVVPFDIARLGLQDAFIVGGGYKYCQLGEGNCFLRFPSECELRPIVTGWFAEFDELEKPRRVARRDRFSGQRADVDPVGYPKGDGRFAGATYDPTSHYRAAAVFDFLDSHELMPEFLREISQHQVGLLAREFDALDLDPKIIQRDTETPLEMIGGFLALASPHAERIHGELRTRDIHTDYRGEHLRLGPAPYLSDGQLKIAIAALGEIARSLP